MNKPHHYDTHVFVLGTIKSQSKLNKTTVCLNSIIVNKTHVNSGNSLLIVYYYVC